MLPFEAVEGERTERETPARCFGSGPFHVVHVSALYPA